MQRVRSARAAVLPSRAPLSPQMPVGTSIATRTLEASLEAQFRASSRASISGPGARVWPLPNRASIQSSVPSAGGGSTSTGMPSQRACLQCCSLRGLRRWKGLHSRTGIPARWSSLATTSPSPPLWPGPTSTTTPSAGIRPAPPRSCKARRRRLTASAAFSIRASTGSPLANSSASSSAICWPLISRWSASRRGQHRDGSGLGVTAARGNGLP